MNERAEKNLLEESTSSMGAMGTRQRVTESFSYNGILEHPTSSGGSINEIMEWVRRTNPGSGQTCSNLVIFPSAAEHPLVAASDQMDVPAGQTTSSAIMESRRISGLTWDQLSELFSVSRRALHQWASGGQLNADNEKHLRKTLATLRKMDRGFSATNRNLLLAEFKGVVPLELLKERKYEDFLELVGPGAGREETTPIPLSEAAAAARRPPPPAMLVGALHDPVHRDPGKSRLVKLKSRRPEP